jgi:DNA-directed RNA polymerase subunit RPC12/RpoP
VTHYGSEELPDRDPTPTWIQVGGAWRCPKCGSADIWFQRQPDHDDTDYRCKNCGHEWGDSCNCEACTEAAWDRLQEAQAESPSEWNEAYKGPI